MSEAGNRPVVIVGGGIAGLSCALYLQKLGIPFRLFEADEKVGGRVQTDMVEGHLLDRGFQVYLDAYPETGKLLDLNALQLRKFEPGGLIYRNGTFHRLMDVFRRPASAFSTLRAPVGTFLDKARVGLLRTKLSMASLERIASSADQPTESYLRSLGFSEDIIDSFFRAFYGGVFLERDLQTSSRMFAFTFKMFTHGSATLPKHGMGEIPKQLARQLAPDSVYCGCAVASVDRDHVRLMDDSRILARAVVVATNATAAFDLLGDLGRGEDTRWRPATTLYFSAPESPVDEPIICLNGTGCGLINNLAVNSDVSSAYAPDGLALISISVLGKPAVDDLVAAVQLELSAWFGAKAEKWKHLRTDRIPRALPEQLPSTHASESTFRYNRGIWICGDYLSSASIEGAVISGKQTAEALTGALSS